MHTHVQNLRQLLKHSITASIALPAIFLALIFPLSLSVVNATAGDTGSGEKKTENQKQSSNQAPQAIPATLENARIDDIDQAHNTVTVKDCPWNPAKPSDHECTGPTTNPTLKDSLKAELKNFHKKDHVALTFESAKLVQDIAISKVPVTSLIVGSVLAISFIVCMLIVPLVLTLRNPLKLIIGEDGRYSNSKFQMAIWFSVVISIYLAAVFLRTWQIGWDFALVGIPHNLLLLSGMSALTFGAAKSITTNKVQAAENVGKTTSKTKADKPKFLSDLTQNDQGQFDVGDFQMLVVTLIAVAVYLLTTFHSLQSIESWSSFTLPDVDTTILATFGLGQGAYLAKKAAGNVGTS